MTFMSVTFYCHNEAQWHCVIFSLLAEMRRMCSMYNTQDIVYHHMRVNHHLAYSQPRPTRERLG